MLEKTKCKQKVCRLSAFWLINRRRMIYNSLRRRAHWKPRAEIMHLYTHTRVVLFQGLCALSCARADRWRAIPGIYGMKAGALYILLYAKDRLCAPNKLFYHYILSARTRRLIYFVIVARVALSLLSTLSFCGIIELSKANGTFV
jgi:hypothetical protein